MFFLRKVNFQAVPSAKVRIMLVILNAKSTEVEEDENAAQCAVHGAEMGVGAARPASEETALGPLPNTHLSVRAAGSACGCEDVHQARRAALKSLKSQSLAWSDADWHCVYFCMVYTGL